METRKYGEFTTLETRKESHDKVNKKLRYLQILDILGNRQMTAKEIAVEMEDKGYTTNDDRNNAAPRLTELCQQGKVDVIGKRECIYSGRRVSVYEVRNG